MKVAILTECFLGWGGGRDFLFSCVNALKVKSESQSLELYLFIPNTVEELEPVIDWLKNFPRDIKIVIHQRSRESLLHYLNQLKIEAVIPAATPLGKDFPLPWVGYIYDFQHKYYPDFFTNTECKARDKHFAKMLYEAKAVIVGAKAVKEDILKFYPGTPCKIFNLPFAPVPLPAWFEQYNDVEKIYKLPTTYFIISNQFWIHKSHETAFKALAILKEKTNSNVAMVCTGKTEDHRYPKYLEHLQEVIKIMGIEDSLFILGHLPKNDQLQIMRKSVAVLQPTLFEGAPGGGSVRQAVSLGVPVIMSDIPVNREISNPGVTFFKVGSAVDLAEKMDFVLSKKKSNWPDQASLIQQGRVYAEALGDRLLEAIHSSFS